MNSELTQAKRSATIPIITGATATGKSALALALAPRLNAELISCDSVQVYRGLNIATAKPTAEEQALIRHHLIDIAEPTEAYSVARFTRDVQVVIEDVLARGKYPLLVGGTGMYISAVLEGIDYSILSGDSKTHERLAARLKSEGNIALWKELSEFDPEAAAEIPQENTRRLLRALEVYYSTGRTKTEWDQIRRKGPLYDFRLFSLEYPREELYKRIEQRAEKMLRNGLLDETRYWQQLELEPNLPAARIIGYREMLTYLEGKSSLPESMDELVRNTRRYAKRQLTWIRNKMSATSLPGGDLPAAMNLILRSLD
ncbi:MAG: tRNA (adenosine(37)-N6)-dimethylallyltransferase MiaA [Clostridiaceae bacterium]|nr:tRNA (adenosine(37)-N6)-dimethylallyltransferase MiaA [Clostridiaceae bacterium]